MIREINAADYAEMDKSGPYLLEFFSRTCGPCKMLSFVLKDIDKTTPDFRIYQVDFNENKDLKEQCGVKGFPTMLFMKDGRELSRLEGLKQKPAIIAEIEKLVSAG